MTATPLLEVRGLNVVFQGVRAADAVNFSVQPQQFVAIIGPNGSGKTTFINLCTGYVRPESGEIYLGGKRITGLAPRSITRLGIARAFQIPQLFADRTLLDNLLLAIAARTNIWQALHPLRRAAYQEEALALLDLVGLYNVADLPVSALSEGTRKLSDIVVALALKPRLLLLDEPTSGVSAKEKFSLMDTLMSALRKADISAVFVEHDMDIVRGHADRVAVWSSGRVVTEGLPDDVLNDSYVRQNVIGVG